MNVQFTKSTGRTVGLTKLGQAEICLNVNDATKKSDVISLLNFVWDYIVSTGRRIVAGETLAYGSWPLKFEADDDMLAVWEIDASGESWVPGAQRAIHHRSTQEAYCRARKSEYAPPPFDSLAAISDGVLEGKPVEGIRYRAPQHMSGWYFTTQEYSGEVTSLKTVHIFHVMAHRPDLIKYIALSPGYYFDQSRSDDAYFSEAIASEEP